MRVTLPRQYTNLLNLYMILSEDSATPTKDSATPKASIPSKHDSRDYRKSNSYHLKTFDHLRLIISIPIKAPPIL